jgi:phosphatidylglycerol:prolipoprotein diacylglycerol transferase
LFTGLGYAVGAFVFWWASRGKGFPREQTMILLMAGFVAGIAGAKVTQALVQGSPGAALDPTAGGRAVFGGILVGWVAVEVVKRRLGIKTSTGDTFALALPAGEAVGRIGCFFNGCCYGSPTTWPVAVYQHGEWRHPAQLYSAVAMAVLFLVLFAIRDRAPYDGALFHLYLAAWGAARFGIEFLRERQGLVFGLDLMQIAALETSVFGLTALTLFTLKRRRREPTA